MSKHPAFGPNPWLQTSWDWRAAGNFIGGGVGVGLLVVSALLAAPGEGAALFSNWLLLLSLALIGLGLLCVWLEIGRPLRALHVFFNPRTSWMSRESLVALLLFPAGLLALLNVAGLLWVTGALALLFLYCQSRMLPATKGIPAWRSPRLTALMFSTGLCEGCGVFVLLGHWHGGVSSAAQALFLVLLVARLAIYWRYRASVESNLAPSARAALNQAARTLLLGGTIAPLLLLLAANVVGTNGTDFLLALAGAGAAFSGANFKYALITRASFNQGFALTQLPVRGVRSGP
ncbi:MAG: hypothetical protein AUJ20_10090 [Comamonadaceae bacterium CG1_02_60_18]|nr:MAG: hypothetical protein AUJ20_10090 [Comamonadaceae bacterium CG1_02_60_18]PIQ56387.1 MAG: phenylacetyl-CoA:acceptor oxidoreductase [Comamonadaceae bacterium CG12_big_fil_rev_8_21_14_0_65_59_15]